MSAAPLLRDLQLQVQGYLFAPEADIAPLSGLVEDVPPLPLAARVAIYKNGYRSRLIDALADTHPILFKVLGDEDFAQVATDFIESRPSTHRSIRWYGRELAAFLAATAPYSEQPIFAELTEFEWALAEVFDACDARVVGREALQGIAPEAWGELCVEFHPSVRRCDLRCNTVAVWQAMSRDEAPPDPEELPQAGHWLLWRQAMKSHFRSLDADERAAFEAAHRGESFAAVCAALGPWVAEAEIPLRAATFIAGWIDSGIVTGAAVA